MRIAFATPEYVTEKTFDGGLSNYVHRIALALKSRGHDPVVFVYSDRDETFVHRDIKIHRVDCRLPHERVKLPMFLKKGYRSLCKRLYPDAYRVYKKTALEYNSYQLNALLLRMHHKNPFDIVQYASYLSPALYRHPSIPSVVRASSYAPLLNAAYGCSNFHEEECEASAFKQAEAIFSPSFLLASQLTTVLDRPVPVIETPFFMEAENLDDALLDAFELRVKQYLLFFGTIGLLKGCLTIAKSLNRLFSQYPQLYFVFAGKISQFQEEKFDVLVRREVRSEYQNRIIFCGNAKHSQLYPVIQAAKGVILPSRVDNLPNTCLEAMGLGKIVVGTRGASFDQLIHDGENGFLCEIDDPGSLFASMQKLLSLSEEKVQQMSKAAIERIKLLHPDIVVPKLLDFYREVIARHKQLQNIKKAT